MQHFGTSRGESTSRVFACIDNGMVLGSHAVTAIEDVLMTKDMQVLQTPLCGYRTFSNVFDATTWEHLHPTMPPDVCEPQKLRSSLYAAFRRSHAVCPPARCGA